MKNRALKILSILMAVCLIWCGTPSVVIGAESLEQHRADLQRSLDGIDERLKKLGDESKSTKEYINTLDKRLAILREQYAVAEQEIASDNSRIIAIEQDIIDNENSLYNMEQDIPLLKAERQEAEADFSIAYDECCGRLRALYISGGGLNNFLSLVVGCDGISMMLNRIQMVSSVAKHDSEMLRNMRKRAEVLERSSKVLEQKQSSITLAQVRLEESKAELKRERSLLFEKQEDLARQRTVIEDEQAEANSLLKQLADKTREYGEYRDITSAELKEIDEAIAFADKRYQLESPSTTNDKDSDTTNKADRFIHLTYPCPSYTRVTCGFGDYDGHSGCDFSTDGNENEKIVASEDGTVILVKLLDYSYGHYVVIRHNKLTKKGERVYTLYAHNNDILVKEGQSVKKGQQIAYSGTTGNSTGPHCHFEVRVGGPNQSDAKNPVQYLR